ncbi:hypothetical protein V1J52_04065 [Streptomyces sp. TRM 70351]|uniref:hypothetical protein n=1 Tax=Streptomyces sp. TRM 70351 TaxID=3116552 RepID=UPI002E7B0D95|nr:hypothetical protein [Streptomyces sp. TRM 70351]MEE1927365.1 hypothetical protein [Streptomyces sp. TRM 70351]
MAAPVIVHAPAPAGGRAVTTRSGDRLGVAYGPQDLLEFLRRAGLAEDDFALDDRSLIEWRGAGPDVWEAA